jgi:hypothetical protein
MPAYTPPGAVIATDLAIVTGPYPPESSATTSPPAATAATAAAKPRHGKSSEQGLASLPPVDTNVRCGPPAPGAGNPRISPPGKTLLWTLK